MTKRRPSDAVSGLAQTRRSMGDGTLKGRSRIATPYDRRRLRTPASSVMRRGGGEGASIPSTITMRAPNTEIASGGLQAVAFTEAVEMGSRRNLFPVSFPASDWPLPYGGTWEATIVHEWLLTDTFDGGGSVQLRIEGQPVWPVEGESTTAQPTAAYALQEFRSSVTIVANQGDIVDLLVGHESDEPQVGTTRIEVALREPRGADEFDPSPFPPFDPDKEVVLFAHSGSFSMWAAGGVQIFSRGVEESVLHNGMVISPTGRGFFMSRNHKLYEFDLDTGVETLRATIGSHGGTTSPRFGGMRWYEGKLLAVRSEGNSECIIRLIDPDSYAVEWEQLVDPLRTTNGLPYITEGQWLMSLGRFATGSGVIVTGTIGVDGVTTINTFDRDLAYITRMSRDPNEFLIFSVASGNDDPKLNRHVAPTFSIDNSDGDLPVVSSTARSIAAWMPRLNRFAYVDKVYDGDTKLASDLSNSVSRHPSTNPSNTRLYGTHSVGTGIVQVRSYEAETGDELWESGQLSGTVSDLVVQQLP